MARRFEYMITGEHDVRCIGYRGGEIFTPFFTIGREYHVVDNVVIDDSGDERKGIYYRRQTGSVIDHLSRYYIFEDANLVDNPVEYADILPNELEEFFLEVSNDKSR